MRGGALVGLLLLASCSFSMQVPDELPRSATKIDCNPDDGRPVMDTIASLVTLGLSGSAAIGIATCEGLQCIGAGGALIAIVILAPIGLGTTASAVSGFRANGRCERLRRQANEEAARQRKPRELDAAAREDAEAAERLAWFRTELASAQAADTCAKASAIAEAAQKRDAATYARTFGQVELAPCVVPPSPPPPTVIDPFGAE